MLQGERLRHRCLLRASRELQRDALDKTWSCHSPKSNCPLLSQAGTIIKVEKIIFKIAESVNLHLLVALWLILSFHSYLVLFYLNREVISYKEYIFLILVIYFTLCSYMLPTTVISVSSRCVIYPIIRTQNRGPLSINQFNLYD